MSHRTRLQPVIEFASIAGFFVGMGLLLTHLVFVFRSWLPAHPWGVPVLVIIPLLGYLAADFASGFAHFMGDSFFKRNTPIIGRAFIAPFRDHHVDPEGITTHGFLEVNGNNCLVSLFVIPIAYYLAGPYPLLASFIFFSLLGLFVTNQLHKWAHQKHPTQVVRMFQKFDLILSPKRHQLHHVAPFQSDFCITVGWMNPLLNRVKFFPRAHRILSKVLPADSSY